jgi:hypothetical protein
MKIKQLLTQICILLLVLFTVKSLVGGFVFSKSSTYVALFLALYSFSGWFTTRIQIFFLLPRIVPFMVLLHSALLMVLFYIGNALIGGITITTLAPSFLHLFSKSVSQQMLGEFGTIGVVAFLIGIVYQLIIWLNSER